MYKLHEVTIGELQRLTWNDIQARGRWCNDQNFLHKQRYHDAKMYGKPDGPYVVTFMFYELDAALLFKLTWGGK